MRTKNRRCVGKDFMVAIILDNEDMDQLKLICDAASSLLRPHISLLYGFAEMHQGGVQLATRAIKDSIISVFREQSSSPRTMLLFSAESLDVFEHRSSPTLVARPDVQYDGNKWLMQLYDALGSRSWLCNNQVMHSIEDYASHGKRGSVLSSCNTIMLMKYASPLCFSSPSQQYH